MAESHRSFTIRVPQTRYVELSDLAKADNTNLNAKVNELITLGLGRNVDIDAAISRFVKRMVVEDVDNG